MATEGSEFGAGGRLGVASWRARWQDVGVGCTRHPAGRGRLRPYAPGARIRLHAFAYSDCSECVCATKFDFRAWDRFPCRFLYILRFAGGVRACGAAGRNQKRVRSRYAGRHGRGRVARRVSAVRVPCSVRYIVVVSFLQFCDPTCVAGSCSCMSQCNLSL